MEKLCETTSENIKATPETTALILPLLRDGGHQKKVERFVDGFYFRLNSEIRTRIVHDFSKLVFAGTFGGQMIAYVASCRETAPCGLHWCPLVSVHIAGAPPRWMSTLPDCCVALALRAKETDIANMITEQLLDQNEIAAVLGVSTETIRRWKRHGLPMVSRRGNRPLFVTSMVRAWHDEYQRALSERKRKKPAGEQPAG